MNCPKHEVDNKYKTVHLGLTLFLVFRSYGYFYLVYQFSGFLFIWSSGFGLMDQLVLSALKQTFWVCLTLVGGTNRIVFSFFVFHG